MRIARLRRAVASGFSGTAVFCLLWLFLPAPLYVLWLLAVGATEWSLWFGLLGLAGAILGILNLRQLTYEPGRSARLLDRAAVALGFIAALASLLPWAFADDVAVDLQRSQSLTAYVFGVYNVSELFRGQSPEAAVRCETIPYAKVGGQTLSLDVYSPFEIYGRHRPAVIVIHGGSWKSGHKSDFPQWDQVLAERGAVVFDIDYRLQPAPNWREAVGDVKTAVSWVYAHQERYHFDPNRVCLLGRSAGGQLALLAAYSTGDPALPPSDGSIDRPVHSVVSLYGPTDLVWDYNHPSNPDVINGPAVLRRYLGGDPQAAAYAYHTASPIEHVRPGLPFTLLVHGNRDLLVKPENSQRLCDRLLQAGNRCWFITMPFGLHGFDAHLNGWNGQNLQSQLMHFLFPT